MDRSLWWRARPRMKKKLEKLLHDPKNFFLDLRRLQPMWQRLGVQTRHTRAEASLQQQLTPEAEERLKAECPAFAAFDLVGENWLDEDRRPVAVMVGFKPWKRKFVSRYLHDYRTAYVRGRPPWSELKQQCEAIQGFSFVVWGMPEEPELTHFATQNNIPLLRMEDGFIRSAELGSRHTTALSLVLDSRGIYFDASKPSDLEDLLNEHDFSRSPHLLEASGLLMHLMRRLGISKYNLGSLQRAQDALGSKVRRRVLVIGQVEDDASILHGLGKGWTNLRLIKLAKQENPDADVFYRPHPDVAHGFRVNGDSLQTLQTACRVLTEDLMLADLLAAVDHVYTLTSLSGFEALVHGLPVTVIGAPFYAGWGLTDDRTSVPRRKRRLKLEELFCAAYLLYPRYLGSPTDQVEGCLSAILAVTAQRRQAVSAAALAIAAKRPEHLLSSEFWPVAFRSSSFPILETKFGKKLSSALGLPRIFATCSGDHFQRSMAYLLAGHMENASALDTLVSELRSCIKAVHFSALLADLQKLRPTPVLVEHWAWYCEQSGDTEGAEQALQHLAYGSSYACPPSACRPVSLDKRPQLLKLAQLQLRRRRIDEAYGLFNQLLLSRYITGDVFAGLAEVARYRFDFDSAAALLRFFNLYDPGWKQGRLQLTEAQNASLAGEAITALKVLSLACRINPQAVESVGSVADALVPAIGDLPYAGALQAMSDIEDAGSPISRAKGLIASHRFAEAERLLLSSEPKVSELQKHCLTLSAAYSFQGKLEQAKVLVKRRLELHPSVLVYREALRLAVQSNDYSWGRDILRTVDSQGIDVGDIYHRKILLGIGDIKGSYLSFRRMRASKTLRAYLDKRYVQSLDFAGDDPDSLVVILAFFGPGDEVRFASLYERMRDRLAGCKVTFTCDPRLLGILRRSYPHLDFVPVRRIRSLAWLPDMEAVNDLPGSDLHPYVDNEGWQLINAANKTILTTDALGDVIAGYESFTGSPYLRASSQEIVKWRECLRPWSHKPLVGLSWRSSLTTYSRSEHYLQAEELVPFFELSDVQFINLQYDECSKELHFLQSRFPGRIINFPELDQYNDFDGVAALMSCLDMIVAPATTVVELSGALGRPTLLLSNSSELHWRKRPGSTVDVWHGSVFHVEGETVGNKSSLVRAAARTLVNHPLLTTCKELGPRKAFWSTAQ